MNTYIKYTKDTNYSNYTKYTKCGFLENLKMYFATKELSFTLWYLHHEYVCLYLLQQVFNEGLYEGLYDGLYEGLYEDLSLRRPALELAAALEVAARRLLAPEHIYEHV